MASCSLKDIRNLLLSKEADHQEGNKNKRDKGTENKIQG